MSNWNGTGIRWTDETWNAVHGCSKTSEGCRACYAERVSRKYNNTDHPWTIAHADDNVQLKPYKLGDLDTLPGPCWVFVNSMSDQFHQLVPDEFIRKTLNRLAQEERSAFQILTKHGPDQDRDVPEMPQNVMLGVSVESPRREYRLDWLREQDAETKFVSFEPLVECIPGTDTDLSGIDWAIIGGESGPDGVRRQMSPAWARNLVRACRRQDVAVFFKQHSGPRPESNIKLDMRDGRGPRNIEEFPELPSGIIPAPREFLEVECAECGAVFTPGEDGRVDVPREPGLCSGCIGQLGTEPGEIAQLTLSDTRGGPR